MDVSVIIPNYNKVNYIEETIASLAENQTDNVEWIVVDDGSTDGSISTLEDLAKKHPQLQFFKNSGKGGSSARNYGVKQARGKYLIFLDSDDLVSYDCISMRLKAVNSYRDCDMWVFPMGVFREQPGDLSSSLNWAPTQSLKLPRFLSHQLPWVICQPIWRRMFFEKIGGFDERFPRLQDVELHTKALLHNARVKCFPDLAPDCFYRISENRILVSAEDFQKKYINGAILYYNTFFSQLDEQQQKYLAGTLLETLSVLTHQSRQGSFDRYIYHSLVEKLIECCRIEKQRKVLRYYATMQSRSPIHIKGLKRLTRFTLGI